MSPKSIKVSFLNLAQERVSVPASELVIIEVDGKIQIGSHLINASKEGFEKLIEQQASSGGLNPPLIYLNDMTQPPSQKQATSYGI